MVSDKISSDGVPIGSGTFATILGGITIWNPWSNETDANLEDSACTVQVLLFFPICHPKFINFFMIKLDYIYNNS